MNETKIDWAEMSWNPVSGCLHGCEYCYARGIANRFAGFEPRGGGEVVPNDKKKYGENSIWNSTHGETLHVFSKHPVKRTKEGTLQIASYPYGFDPTFHRYRLKEPAHKTKGRTIFVCSMADLFGDWVPTEWIVSVMDACRAAPQHRYLFLTKNPKRYIDLDKLALLPRENNFWYGSTVTGPDMPFFYSEKHNTFLSIEPLLEEFKLSGASKALSDIKWVIIGAESGIRKEKVVPKKEWVEEIIESCHAAKVPVFMKTSLTGICECALREFPWEETE